MPATTAELWAKQDEHEGDRGRLFLAVSGFEEVTSVLYPGSYVDLAPSFVWPTVTYVDIDARAARFFADEEGVAEIISSQPLPPANPSVRFLAADYTEHLPLQKESFDLLVSLYAGPVSVTCVEYLRVGGILLANSSHGDVALASLDDRYELTGVVRSTANGYSLSTSNLDAYLVPKKPIQVTVELIEQTGRGVAYTKSPFAYLFRRVK